MKIINTYQSKEWVKERIVDRCKYSDWGDDRMEEGTIVKFIGSEVVFRIKTSHTYINDNYYTLEKIQE